MQKVFEGHEEPQYRNEQKRDPHNTEYHPRKFPGCHGQQEDNDELYAKQQEKGPPARPEELIFLVNGGNAYFSDK